MSVALVSSLFFIFGLAFFGEYLVILYSKHVAKIERFGRKLEFIIVSHAIGYEMILKSKIIQAHRRLSSE